MKIINYSQKKSNTNHGSDHVFTDPEFWQIDSRLQRVHTILTQLLAQIQNDLIGEAEEILNDARDILHFPSCAFTIPSIEERHDDYCGGGK